MRRYSPLGLALLLTLMTAGCSLLGARPTPPPRISGQELAFATALGHLRRGNEADARAELERVVAAPPLAGVSDEALFRLALLVLHDAGDKGLQHSQLLLTRLKSEFPDSIWTHQAAPLEDLLDSTRSLRSRQRELKSLREQNLSLSRDNKELRQSIERLKNLDVELELKIKR